MSKKLDGSNKNELEMNDLISAEKIFKERLDSVGEVENFMTLHGPMTVSEIKNEVALMRKKLLEDNK